MRNYGRLGVRDEIGEVRLNERWDAELDRDEPLDGWIIQLDLLGDWIDALVNKYNETVAQLPLPHEAAAQLGFIIEGIYVAKQPVPAPEPAQFRKPSKRDEG